MNCEDDYAEYVSGLLSKVKAIETNWLARSEENASKQSQFPSEDIRSSDYRAMGWRSRRSYFLKSNCDRCGSTSTKTTSMCAGCRHNGDGYGSQFYYCEDCGLLDWDSYDEA